MQFIIIAFFHLSELACFLASLASITISYFSIANEKHLKKKKKINLASDTITLTWKKTQPNTNRWSTYF